MCTIIVAARPDDGLVVAANRDEHYARASLPPTEVRPGIVAGIDRVAGGSWMGVNSRGLFVALTNQRTHYAPDSARRSRGAIVIEALERDGVDAVEVMLRALDADAYNPFNLIFGVPGDVRVAYVRDRAAVELVQVEGAIAVLANDRLGSREFPKIERAVDLASAGTPLERLLGDHHKPPLETIAVPPHGSIFTRELVQELQAICIHTPSYGTVSSTVLEYERGRLMRYRFANGAPCVTPFLDVGLPEVS